MSNGTVRVGIVGAGNNTRVRHIPGLRSMEGVEIVSVCNRSRESSERVASQFEIPVVYDSWLDLVESDDTDAICIGTWPYMHCPMTLAALENNKHVLCEARMALNAEEAHAMLDASRLRPHLVTQIVPSPMTFKVDPTITEHVANGYLGDVLAIEVRVTQPSFVDTDGPMHWRHDRSLSGYNVLTMGIWYEAMMRWAGPASRVMAMTKVNVTQRQDDQGELQHVTVPDHVEHPLRDGIRGPGAHALQRRYGTLPRRRGMAVRQRRHPTAGGSPFVGPLRRTAGRQRAQRDSSTAGQAGCLEGRGGVRQRHSRQGEG